MGIIDLLLAYLGPASGLKERELMALFANFPKFGKERAASGGRNPIIKS